MAKKYVSPLSEHAQTKDFLAFLRLKNLSPLTIALYRAVLHDLFIHLDPVPDSPGQVTSAQLRSYVAALYERGLAAKTINDRVVIMRRFYGFLAAEGHTASDPARGLPVPKVGKRLPKALSIDETKRLLAAMSGESGRSRRDRTLFTLMYSCGLRVTEAVTLRVEDINLADGSLQVVGKGDKERRGYLKPALVDLLRGHIAVAGVTGYLFPGAHGGHLTARNARDRLISYAKQAGITKHVSPHTLRHSIAVHYLQGGAPVSFVQGLLGHASLATTGVYLQLTDQMAKEITLTTETALEKVAPQKELREPRAVYEAEAVDWDVYVDQVLEWLPE